MLSRWMTNAPLVSLSPPLCRRASSPFAARNSPQKYAGLHQRASTWYEQNDLTADAVHHALAAEDFERAARIIELAWAEMDQEPSGAHLAALGKNDCRMNWSAPGLCSALVMPGPFWTQASLRPQITAAARSRTVPDNRPISSSPMKRNFTICRGPSPPPAPIWPWRSAICPEP